MLRIPLGRGSFFALLVTSVTLAACGGTAASTAPSASSASAKPAATAPASSASVKPSASSSSASASTSGAAGKAATTVEYGISGVTVEVLPLWMAQAQGFDKKYGLNLHVVDLEGGSKGLEVLLGGNLQVMDVGLAPVIIANSQGADFRVIDSTSNAIPFTIVGGKGITPENAAAKLKGSKIGISSFGSESDIAVSLYLNKIGLVRDKDVTVVQIGGVSNRLSALLSGAVSAAPLTAPQVLTSESQGLKSLIDLSSQSQWVFEASVLTKSYLDSHRDVAMNLLKALMEGNFYARAHPDEAKKVIGKQFKYNDQKLIDVTYDEFLKVTPVSMRPTDQGIKEVLQQLASVAKIKEKSQNAADYLDLSLLDELKTSGFVDQAAKQYGVK